MAVALLYDRQDAALVRLGGFEIANFADHHHVRVVGVRLAAVHEAVEAVALRANRMRSGEGGEALDVGFQFGGTDERE